MGSGPGASNSNPRFSTGGSMKVCSPEGDRGGNVGKRPVYRYSCRHYRRVLQVLRIYARGIKGRDEILIMLFLNGHGVKPFEVREPMGGTSKARPSSMLSCGRRGSTRKGKFHPSTKRAWFAAWTGRRTIRQSRSHSSSRPNDCGCAGGALAQFR